MRSSPRKEPPERPEPRCEICGSLQVTKGSIHTAVPLCEEHDSEVTRKRAKAERDLERAKTGMGEEQHKLMEYQYDKEWDDRAERIQKRIQKWKDRAQTARDRLKEVREGCDHPDLEVQRDEAGDVVPADYRYGLMCPECGWQDEHWR